jgi:hypothetical protein
MRRLACLTMLLVLGVAQLSSGAAPEPKPAPAPSVDQLIIQLGNRDFKVRTASARAITALGGAALPELRKARMLPDVEVQHQLDDLIAHLERVVTLSPKVVTLHMEKKTIRDVLAALAKQTGFKIPTNDPGFNTPQGKKTYTFHFDKVPFWTALDQVCEASGLLLQQQAQDDTLRLSFQDSYVPFVSYDGSFKVTATGFSYNRNTNFGDVQRIPYQLGGQNQEWLQVNLTVAVEPRVPITKVGQVKLTCAEDDAHCSMLCTGGNDYQFGWWGVRYYNGGVQRSFVQQASTNLAWPTKSSKTVKVLKGIIPVTLLAEQRPTVVTHKLLSSQGKKFKAGNATFNIDSVVTQKNKQYEVKISYSEESGDNNYDWSRIQSVQQRISFQDEKGLKYQQSIRSTSYNGPNSAQFGFHLNGGTNSKLGPPAKVVFQLWIEMEHEVAFEFKNLPLP